MSDAFVVVMGVGTVFVGLILLIIVVKIMTAIMGRIFPSDAVKKTQPSPAAAPVAPVAAAPVEIPDKGAFVAAVSAAIAEDLGTDVSHIRIHKIRRL